MSEVVISYNSDDYEVVAEIYSALDKLGVDVWMDKGDNGIPGGRNWKGIVRRKIIQSRVFVAIVGMNKTKESQYYEFKEAIIKSEKSNETDFKIVPVSLDGNDIDKFPPEWKDISVTEIITGKDKVSQESLDKLIHATTGRHSKTIILQTHDHERFVTQIENRDTPVRVYRLPIQSDVAKPLQLSWETFGIGIEALSDQIQEKLKGRIIDSFIGINDAGHAIATFLNFNYCKESRIERKEVGYIKFRGIDEGGRILENQVSFPENLRDNPLIILVDFELKTGNGLEATLEIVREAYSNPCVYLAAFGSQVNNLVSFGSHVDDLNSIEIEDGKLDDLTSYNKLNKLSLNGLLTACIMSEPGIQPPLGLR